MYNYIYHHNSKHDFTYVAIRKNATTSIAAALWQLETGIDYEDDSFPEDPNLTTVFNYSSEYVPSSTKLVFTCVRDPYERLVSGFYHKVFAHPRDEASAFISSSFNEDIYRNDNDISKYFERFLSFIEHVGVENVDHHFSLQTKCGHFDKINYDIVLNVKNLYDQWGSVQKAVPTMPDLPRHKIHETNSENLLDIFEFSRSRVEALYVKDYEMLSKYL